MRAGEVKFVGVSPGSPPAHGFTPQPLLSRSSGGNLSIPASRRQQPPRRGASDELPHPRLSRNRRIDSPDPGGATRLSGRSIRPGRPLSGRVPRLRDRRSSHLLRGDPPLLRGRGRGQPPRHAPYLRPQPRGPASGLSDREQRGEPRAHGRDPRRHREERGSATQGERRGPHRDDARRGLLRLLDSRRRAVRLRGRPAPGPRAHGRRER